MRTALTAAALLAGCPGKGEDTSSPPSIDTLPHDTSACEGTPPVAVVESCDYPGMQECELSGGEKRVPTIRFRIDSTDEDGDLDMLRIDLYVDASGVVDGVVDPADAEYVAGTPRSVQGAERCDADQVVSLQTLCLPTGFVDWGENYDWGVVVVDAAGLSSDMAVVTCPAPLADGSEPAR